MAVSLKHLNVNQASVPNTGFQDGMGVLQRVGVVQIRGYDGEEWNVT